MIPYNSPNLGILRIIKAFFQFSFEEKVIRFFYELTGKKYILLTSSCRTALHLAYSCIEKKGAVLASPLTCKSALEPLLETKNTVIFCDIDPSTLNINPDIAANIAQQAFAIQVIHFGGIPNDMDKISRLAKDHHLLIIEDCAQSLGAFYKGKSVGSFGDIACFSLIKTGYGIGGGILATNDETVYLKAKELQDDWAVYSKKIVFFRLVRSFIETNRSIGIFDWLYKKLMGSRKFSSSYRKERETSDFANYMRQPSCMFFKVFAAQMTRLSTYWNQRREVAQELIDTLKIDHYKIMLQESTFLPSFTKLYIKTTRDSAELIHNLYENKIEAKHLEQKYMTFYQTRFDDDREFSDCKNLKGCVEYFKIHNNLVSLPLFETMSDRQIQKIQQGINACQ